MTNSIEKEITRLRDEIAKRKQEIVDLDAKSAKIAAADPEGALDADTRARAIERLLPRLLFSLKDLVQKKAETDEAAARETVEKTGPAALAALDEHMKKVGPLMDELVSAFRSLSANKTASAVLKQLVPGLTEDAVENLVEFAPTLISQHRAQAAQQIALDVSKKAKQAAEDARRIAEAFLLEDDEPQTAEGAIA